MKILFNSLVIERNPLLKMIKPEMWDVHVGKSGNRWLIPRTEAPAENIHVEGGPNSDGYGGSTLTFMTPDGEVSLKGPWHSNAEALLKDTGIDIRDKHRTVVTVGLQRKIVEGRYLHYSMEGVLYHEEVPVLGKFHRDVSIVRKILEETGLESVMVWRESSGGSSLGSMGMKDVEYWEKIYG